MRNVGMRMRAALLSFVTTEGRMAVKDTSQVLFVSQLPCKQRIDPFWRFSAHSRGFQTGMLLCKDIEVEIQQMGESISEGTIAEILKQEGDSVDEDETIAQIETDKVTIDVKAPSAGTLKSLKVSIDDTVTVGQVVAIIGEGQASGSDDSSSASKESTTEKSAKTEPSKDSSQSEGRSTESSSNKSENEASDHSRAHAPMIRFPQRMTPDGKRISELPAEEQRQYLSHGGKDSEHTQPQSQAEKAPSKSSPQSSSSYMSWYVGREQGTKLSQSSVLSEYEMEQIELGGAVP